jgi:transposase
MSCYWRASEKPLRPPTIMTNKPKVKSEARADQAASNKCETIKLGLDVHAKTIVVVRILDHSAPQPAQTFTPEKFKTWVKTQLGLALAVHSCYEAGPFGYDLHRYLVGLGIKNVVVQPVCLDEQHKGVNHDKRDAQELALRLDRYVAGNTHALAFVRVPTPAEEQKRAASRQREQIKRAVQRVAAQGRGLLLTQGYHQQKGWWAGRRWAQLQPTLPAWLVERLEVFRRLLDSLTSELETATTALEQVAPELRPKGLGGLTYETVEREVCAWDRFTNRRQVGSYTGLCGGVSSSGQSHRLLLITKHGNVRLRTALVELAWRMVTWQPESKLVKRWWPVVGNPRAPRAARKKAIVAMARQLAVDLWRWRTGRVQPADLGWVMVGAAA